MGNRGGRFHTAERTLTKRRWASRQWIACELHFKNRHRDVWGNSYTELFFLDEVTALAAGHRPCCECRRAEAKAFLAGRKVPEFDRMLHTQRLGKAPLPPLRGTLSKAEGEHVHHPPLPPLWGGWRAAPGEVPSPLPDGVMFESEGSFFAIKSGKLLHWSFAGYVSAETVPQHSTLRLLTPPTIVQILQQGYQPRWHPSALQWEAT